MPDFMLVDLGLALGALSGPPPGPPARALLGGAAPGCCVPRNGCSCACAAGALFEGESMPAFLALGCLACH
jgi:hypothetical protein